MSVRRTYHINKTKFLLWKEHAHPALKILLVGVAALAVLAGIVALALS
jgi:hypothetical protein